MQSCAQLAGTKTDTTSWLLKNLCIGYIDVGGNIEPILLIFYTTAEYYRYIMFSEFQ